jgi:redox-sensitive bicupin YhaK (pirin superfamily)
VKLFQTWVFPKLKNVEPRYDQKMFSPESRQDRFCTIVSPEKKDDSLWLHQDAWYSLGNFSSARTVDYDLHLENNGVYIFVIEGKISIDGSAAGRRDAIGVWETKSVSIEVEAGTELLLIEVPMR